ncbi:sulfatase [Luteolibacter algae]|uniref:Sulfatase n=1 Tax=Luteolibacter algae TaxID=454151 RepID=A0ABW5D904_9BACT
MKSLLSLFFLLLLPLRAAELSDTSSRPNLLFVCADDMSHASAYGYKFVKTPNFDSIAEKGLLFDRMYTPSSKCAPSRAVMLTGRNPWQLEGAANHKPVWPEKFLSYVEALTNNGYFSGYTGKGWNPGIHPKGRDLTGREYNRILVEDPPLKGLAAYDYAANFEEFLAAKPSDQPFFFWYGSKEPHRGYEFRSGHRAGKSLDDLDFLPSFWGNSESVKHDILDYALEVEYFDEHLGKILRSLEAAGELDNTLIIATSDNAMPFPRYKGHPHEFATRIPFAVCWPGKIVNPGRRCEQFASFIDIAPTFLEAAGIDPAKSGMQPIEGLSLFDFFEDRVSGRDDVLTGRERNDIARPNGWGYPVRSYHQGAFVYMHNFEPDRWPAGTPEANFPDTDGSPTKSAVASHKNSREYELCYGKRPQQELYNVAEDPECLVNLADHPEYASKMKEMKTALFERLHQQGDPRVTGVGKIFDEYRPERFEEYQSHLKKK